MTLTERGSLALPHVPVVKMMGACDNVSYLAVQSWYSPDIGRIDRDFGSRNVINITPCTLIFNLEFRTLEAIRHVKRKAQVDAHNLPNGREASERSEP